MNQSELTILVGRINGYLNRSKADLDGLLKVMGKNPSLYPTKDAKIAAIIATQDDRLIEGRPFDMTGLTAPRLNVTF